jgi:hypothetical protein
MISVGYEREKKLMAGFLENWACILKKKGKKSHNSFSSLSGTAWFSKSTLYHLEDFFFFDFQTLILATVDAIELQQFLV